MTWRADDVTWRPPDGTWRVGDVTWRSRDGSWRSRDGSCTGANAVGERPMAVGALTMGVGELAIAEETVDIAFTQAEMAGGCRNTTVVVGQSLSDQFDSMPAGAATVADCRSLLRIGVADIAGQVLGLDEIRFPQDEGPMDDVFQLADVAWPLPGHG